MNLLAEQAIERLRSRVERAAQEDDADLRALWVSKGVTLTHEQATALLGYLEDCHLRADGINTHAVLDAAREVYEECAKKADAGAAQCRASLTPISDIGVCRAIANRIRERAEKLGPTKMP